MIHLVEDKHSRALLHDLTDINGEERQLDQLVEECAELIVMVSHYKRGRVGPGPVRSEMADVMVQLAAVRLYIGDFERETGETLEKIEAIVEGESDVL